jgi:hypothetical protein
MTIPDPAPPVGAEHIRRWQDRGWGRVWRIAERLSILMAIAALAIAIGGLQELPTSRRQSARDSCQLIRGLVLTATTSARQAAVEHYIKSTPLHDCSEYARKLVR